MDSGEKASGADDVPIQNVGVRTFKNLSYELFNNRYKPSPAKRVYIMKANGTKRPIGIPTTRDKIVQQALRIILEPIFEPTFSPNSHGFRPNKSCHTALAQIKKEWRMVSYFINLDLEKFFDKLGHKQIILALKKRCSDKHVLSIVYSMLKSGYVTLTNSRDTNLNPTEGTPQGSIISPLLSNIVLNEFDWHVQNVIIPKYNRREKYARSRMSPVYYDATRKFSENDYVLRNRVVEYLDLSMRQAREVIISAKAKVAKNTGIEYSLKDESTERLWYVRYADDFIFGYVGPKKKAQILTSEICYDLGSFGVGVNSDKSEIAHHSKGVVFLSYRISGNYMETAKNKKDDGNSQRSVRSELRFSAPISKLILRAKERGFLMSNKRGKANSKLVARRFDKWLFLQPHEIVSRYRSIMVGLINYYQGCGQRSDLYELLWLYKRSCAITLAHHHKFTSFKKVIVKYGKDLKVQYPNSAGKILTVDCAIPTLEGGGQFTTKVTAKSFPQTIEAALLLPGNLIPKTLHSLQSASELECSIPNCPNKAEEWHHIKHRRNAKINSGAKQRQVAMFSKQIPVCKKHHDLIHSGKYNGPSLNKIKGFTAGDWDPIVSK
jgi:group II intron reverse transcriptase/maturase